MGSVQRGTLSFWTFLSTKTVYCISAYFSLWTQKYLVYGLAYNLEHTLCFHRHLQGYDHCWWQIDWAGRWTKFNNPAFKTYEMLQLSYKFTFKIEDGELKCLQCWTKQHELKANQTQKVTERCVSDIVQWQQRAEEQLQLFTGWFHHSCSELRLSLSPSLPPQSRVFQYRRMPNW